MIRQWNFASLITAFETRSGSESAGSIRSAYDHMQHTETIPSYVTGGRRSSPELRASIEMAEAFEGLPAEVERYDLLTLVKRAGRQAGFTSGMIELLDYYMAFTREADWEEGARPIVFQSLAKTALDFGVSERNIQKTEQALFRAGAITWNDSGNHRRYGQRDAKTGRITYAFGVDLTPLAYLKATLEQKLEEKEARDDAWLAEKRKISWYRAQIRALIGEGGSAEAETVYQGIALPIRTYMSLDALKSLSAEHKECYEGLQKALQEQSPAQRQASITEEKTSMDEQKFVSIYSTNQKQSDKSDNCNPVDHAFRESVTRLSESHPRHRSRGKTAERAGQGPSLQKPLHGAEEKPPVTAGLAHVTWKQVLNAASDRFRAHIPVHGRPLDWKDLVDAATALSPELGISKSAWNEACTVLGTTGAALCVLITDHAALRPKDRVRNPGGYLRAMTRKAQHGELHLHRTIFGILSKNKDQCDA
jgi:replication initiation protein RepC